MTNMDEKELPMELFQPKLLALLMADIFTVLLLRERGGIRSDGEREAPKLKNRGMTLSVIADAISEIFNKQEVKITLALPNLHSMMQSLTGEVANRYNKNSKRWIIRPKNDEKNITKSYFFITDTDPDGDELRKQLEKARRSLRACLDFVEREIEGFDKKI